MQDGGPRDARLRTRLNVQIMNEFNEINKTAFMKACSHTDAAMLINVQCTAQPYFQDGFTLIM